MKTEDTAKKTIEDAILSYTDGITHLEFNACDLDNMVADIKKLVIEQIEDAEHCDDACHYVNKYI